MRSPEAQLDLPSRKPTGQTLINSLNIYDVPTQAEDPQSAPLNRTSLSEKSDDASCPLDMLAILDSDSRTSRRMRFDGDTKVSAPVKAVVPEAKPADSSSTPATSLRLGNPFEKLPLRSIDAVLPAPKPVDKTEKSSDAGKEQSPIAPDNHPGPPDSQAPPVVKPVETESKATTGNAPAGNPFSKLPGRISDKPAVVAPIVPSRDTVPPPKPAVDAPAVVVPAPPRNPFDKIPGRSSDTPAVVAPTVPRDTVPPPKPAADAPAVVVPAPPRNPFDRIPGRSSDTPAVVAPTVPRDTVPPPKPAADAPAVVVPAPPRNPFDRIPGRSSDTPAVVAPDTIPKPKPTTDSPTVTPRPVDTTPLLPRPSWAPVTPSDTLRPSVRPAEIVRPAESKPEKSDIKEKYDTENLQEAVRTAKEKGLPLVVHVGAEWCNPCREMVRESWPGVLKALKGKAVFVHLDVDKAKKLEGAAATSATTITKEVERYPTVRVFTVDSAGKIEKKESVSDKLDEDSLLSFLKVQGIK